MFVKFPLKPGVFKDDTPLAAEGFYIDADKVRFVRDKAETIGGWENTTTDTVQGLCRGLFGWQTADTQAQAAIGTNTHLQAYYDGEIYDATPVMERGTLTDPFTTTNASAVVNVADTAHGRAVGDRVVFDNASAVGGLTLDGEYTVTEVIDVDNYTITAASAATSTAGPGGGTVYYDYLLPIGLADGLGGPGFGVGGFGLGDYSEGASDTQYFPRTWSFDQWGQNLLACPRGGNIFEWRPAYSAAELVTNGDFALTTGWTVGTAWTLNGTNAASTLSSAALSQILVTAANAYNLVEFDLGSHTAGSLSVYLGNTTLTDTFSANGKYRTTFYTPSEGTTLKFSGVSLSCTIDNVSVKQLLVAQTLIGAPTQNTCILVTPQLIVLAGGTIDADTGEFNPMQIRSSDTGDGDLSANQTWTIDPANLSRRWTLAKGGRIVRMLNGNGEVLVYTDTALYAGTYTTDTNTVYQFRLVAEGCGLIGFNAAAVLDGVAYWMTPAGEFKGYSGGAPFDLNCTMSRWIKDNLAPAQQDKIFAFPNSEYGEVWWLFPTIAGPSTSFPNEVSNYALFCPATQTWANGTFDRTAWMDTGAFQIPLAASVDGNLYYQEKGDSADGGALEWSLETGALDQGDGNSLYTIMSFIPDFEDMRGGCSVTLNAYRYPNSTPQVLGPYSVNSSTEKVDMRALGRQITIEFNGNSAPAFMRMGRLSFDVRPTGMTR